MLPPHELFAAQLSYLDFGHALYDPDPNGDYDMVRVGDVGYIEDGKFEKLFNAFHPADAQPANESSRLPAEFRPINEDFRTIGKLSDLASGIRQSESVRKVGGDISGSTEAVSGILVGSCLKLSCESRAGASLITKYPAERYKAKASRALMEYMCENHGSWLKLAERLGRAVEMQDIIFVKECILTRDWANIHWNSKSCAVEVAFNVTVPGAAGIGASLWGEWERHVTVPRSQGPKHVEPIVEGQVPKIDQCIFLKGFRIVLRAWYESLVKRYLTVRAQDKRTSNGPKDSKGGSMVMSSDLSTAGALKSARYSIETVGAAGTNKSSRPIQNAYEVLGIYMLENSDADIVIMDDDDLFSLNIASADSFEKIWKLLEDQGPSVEIITETMSYGLRKVGKIDWMKHSLITSNAVVLTTQEDVVVLDEQFRETSLQPRKRAEWNREEGRDELDYNKSPSSSLNPTNTSPSLRNTHSSLRSFNPSPPPPYPDSPKAPEILNKAALDQYIMEIQKSTSIQYEMKTTSEGAPHRAKWTSVCLINGVEYGRSTFNRKKTAEDETARLALGVLLSLTGRKKAAEDETALQALESLHAEEPPIITGPPYFSKLKKYLEEHNLLFDWRYRSEGLDHKKKWTCELISKDGISIAKGTASTKKDAAEQAAMKTAEAWLRKA